MAPEANYWYPSSYAMSGGRYAHDDAAGYEEKAQRRNSAAKKPKRQAQGTSAWARGSSGAVAIQDEGSSKTAFKPYHAVSVPKKLNLEVEFQTESKGAMTTAMLRNIPNRYTQPTLLREIDAAGFEGTYDFFYLPMDTHNRTNVGYAFINFVRPADMVTFTEAFSDYRFKDHSSQKIGRVSPAHIQGFHENVHHFSNRAVAHSRNSQYRPVIVHRGQHTNLGEAFAVLPQQPYAEPSRSGTRAPCQDALTRLDASAEDFVPHYFERGAAPGLEQMTPSEQWDMPHMVPEWSSSTDEWGSWSTPWVNSGEEDTLAAAYNWNWDWAATRPPESESKEAEYSAALNLDTEEFSPTAEAELRGTLAACGAFGEEEKPEGQGESFSLAKRCFEEAVSKWLQGEYKIPAKVNEASSTESGASDAASSESTPRNGQNRPKEAEKKEAPQVIRKACAMPDEAESSLTPRTNRTLLGSFRQAGI